MVEIVEVKSSRYGVELRLNNGVTFTVCPHPDRFYLTVGGSLLPTYVNDDENNKSNNTLTWHYKSMYRE